MTVTLSSDRAAAVDQAYHWQPMSTCPLSVKVQLLGSGGVAVYGSWDGRASWWRGWAPLPKVPDEWKQAGTTPECRACWGIGYDASGQRCACVEAV